MTEFTLKRNEGGNPIGDMDDILTEAKKRLNGSAKNGLIVSFEDSEDEILIKIKAR